MAVLEAGIAVGNRCGAVATPELRYLQHGAPRAHGSSRHCLASRIYVRRIREDERQLAAAGLRWTSGRGFGVTGKAVFLETGFANSVPKGEVDAFSSKKRSCHVSAFTPEQSKMVKDSWRILQKNNPGEHALKFFLKVFEIAPSVKRMFSFLRESDVPVEKNPELKVHALTVLSMTGQAATQLGEKGALDLLMPKLMELGHSHVAYGVVDEHFDVVKFALLATLAEALPNEWTLDMKEAWSVAYDEIVKEIKNKMHTERAAIKQFAGV